ncbi:MAG: hypothetical protein V4450_02725 [Bacteroidota bacterium]
MELDDFKAQLKHKLANDHSGRSDADLAALLKGKTLSVVGKLKRSLWIEILCCVLIIFGFGYLGFFGKYHSFRIYFSVFTFVSIGFLVLLIYLLRKTALLSATDQPVKSNLQTIVTTIEEFMKRYFQFTMALIPICFTFAFLLGYNEPEKIPEVDHYAKGLFSSATQVIVFMVGYMVLLSVGIYYFTKWYLKKLYGNYINQLKECIAELSEA